MFDDIKVSPDLAIRDALSVLVNGGKKTLFVVDERDILLGLFTNGDMRRFLLAPTDFSLPIEKVMNRTPICFGSRRSAHEFAETKRLIVYPIVADDGKLLDAVFADDAEFGNNARTQELQGVPLVIMAGGKGTRLQPYTQILPKALIPIGDFTITERIINRFALFGCEDIILILNHKANMIKAYFGDLPIGKTMRFVMEEHPMGTGGGLRLIKDLVHSTFFVSNCDILVEDDLACAYATHKKGGHLCTIVCSLKNSAIPYGVLKTKPDGSFDHVQEKPKLSYLVNTGVYVVEPGLLDYIADGETVDMPMLIGRAASAGHSIGMFPVGEGSCFDMGQFETMNEMLDHFALRH